MLCECNNVSSAATLLAIVLSCFGIEVQMAFMAVTILVAPIEHTVGVDFMWRSCLRELNTFFIKVIGDTDISVIEHNVNVC